MKSHVVLLHSNETEQAQLYGIQTIDQLCNTRMYTVKPEYRLTQAIPSLTIQQASRIARSAFLLDQYVLLTSNHKNLDQLQQHPIFRNTEHVHQVSTEKGIDEVQEMLRNIYLRP